jgi:hypothetical protein
MFDDFDFRALDDPEFKEDAVREELVLPLIKSLGYKVTGDSRVVRSRSLIHPYVALGSKKKKVSIVPDYVFMSEGRPYWILDAKAPTEDIIKSKHVEQAYSYAIHPEIRAELFALCNGKKFVLFTVKQFDPLLHFALEDIDNYWEVLCRILHPEIKAHPEVVQYYPDYGVHLHRLGAKAGFTFIALAVNASFISKVKDGLYTTTTVIPAESEYVISLDFGEKELLQLMNLLPKNQASILHDGLRRQPYTVFLKDEDFKFGVISKLTEDIIHNAEESYIPFEVKEFVLYRDFENEPTSPLI